MIKMKMVYDQFTVILYMKEIFGYERYEGSFTILEEEAFEYKK